MTDRIASTRLEHDSNANGEWCKTYDGNELVKVEQIGSFVTPAGEGSATLPTAMPDTDYKVIGSTQELSRFCRCYVTNATTVGGALATTAAYASGTINYVAIWMKK